MGHTFTQTDLVRFIYRETDVLEHVEMLESIMSSEDIRNEYLQLKEGYDLLEQSMIAPKNSSIENILDYSRASLIAV